MPKTKSQLKSSYKAKIKDFGHVVTGKTPPTKNQEYYGDKYPFITPTDISDSSIFVYKPERYLSEEGAKKVASSKLPKNSVCYTCIASVGKTVITKEDSFTNQQINSIIVDLSKADYRYVFYLLRNITPQIKGMVGGAASPIINKSAFENIDIDILDLENQKEVAEILFTYDQLIENNTKRIKILEEIAQAIYKEWFVYFRFPGHEKAKSRNEGSSATGIKMVDSKTEFGKIPEGWGISHLADLVNTQYGYTESAQTRSVGPKYLRGMDINKNTFVDWGTVPYCKISGEDKQKYKLDVGDILVIRMADPGKIGIIEKEIDAVFASYLIRLTIKERLTPYYLFYFLISDKYQDYIGGASGGTTRKSASAGVVTGTDIIIPPKELVSKFEEKVSLFRKELNNLLTQNAKLRQARDLLLPKLISGEIEV